MPEEELTVATEEVDAIEGEPGDTHPPHILDDGVGPAEASDHLDEENGAAAELV